MDTTASSTGSGAGGCSMGPPEALFTLVVTTADGQPIPEDTKLIVRWSAGEEPTVALDDRDSWKTLDDGSNVVCDLDPAEPSPPSLEELRCELWTSGATEVQITAEGYRELIETLTPEQDEDCELPISSEVALELSPDLDAGMR